MRNAVQPRAAFFDFEAVAPSLTKLGFRRWYERQLIEGHVWLVACVLSMIMLAVGFELLSIKTSAGQFLMDACCIVAGLALTAVSWRQYSRILIRAEHVGGQANCPDCGHYGFRLIQEGRNQPLARCPKCQRRWPVSMST